MPEDTKGCKCDVNSNLIEVYHFNPLHDSQFYYIEFLDGNTQEYITNIIGESLYTQVDTKGREHVIFDDIIYHINDVYYI